jgi:hypothetical protein
MAMLTSYPGLQVTLPSRNDLSRFPREQVVLVCLARANAHLRELERQLTEDGSTVKIREYWSRSRRAQKAWFHLSIAQNEDWPISMRLEHLQALRDLIGDDYDIGYMPRPIPEK